MPTTRPLPVLRADRIRRPSRPFAWIDHRLRSDGYLQRLLPSEIALYLFLALAADAKGLSCWRLDRIERELGDWDVSGLHAARKRLIEEDLLSFRPWSPNNLDGCYQLLSISPRKSPSRGGSKPLADCLPSLRSPRA